ncbi:WecB/TagA/CpsF family glycosyltransferase [Sphingomonas glacialis]|nr:WecB/TagA/CpsF family glycosyltransferase [Sphingomonas glacialis]
MKNVEGPTWRAAPPDSESNARRFLGMQLSSFDVDACARHILTAPSRDGATLFVTPNIQHIAIARKDPEFASLLAAAELVVCDGFPVYRYARWRGHDVPARVTGREVIERMMAYPDLLARHRLFFVIDGAQTQAAIECWIADALPGVAAEFVIPPFGFEEDASYCAGLAAQIARFETSLLFLCVGAPRSELFAHRHRALLPPCHALCVGQAFQIALGLTTRPPGLIVSLNLEWAWRIVLAPKRMLRRYGPSAVGFLAAILDDLRGRDRFGRVIQS